MGSAKVDPAPAVSKRPTMAEKHLNKLDVEDEGPASETSQLQAHQQPDHAIKDLLI